MITNHTQRKTFVLPRHTFESKAKQNEILCSALSRSPNSGIKQHFCAAACVEILRKPVFRKRVASALPLIRNISRTKWAHPDRE